MSRSVAIYPPSYAKMLRESAGQKYRPSNGAEGEIFMDAWCCQCARDKSMREGETLDECDDTERCDIIADTLAYAVDHPKYPAAWQYGPDGQPRCTAFVEAGQPIPEPRCEHTVDLFATPEAAALARKDDVK